MLKLIGTTVLTAVIVVSLNAAITVMPLSPVRKLTTVTIAGLWIGLAIALAPPASMLSTATPVAMRSVSCWPCRWLRSGRGAVVRARARNLAGSCRCRCCSD